MALSGIQCSQKQSYRDEKVSDHSRASIPVNFVVGQGKVLVEAAYLP
jgi:hypothetical protein